LYSVFSFVIDGDPSHGHPDPRRDDDCLVADVATAIIHGWAKGLWVIAKSNAFRAADRA
jgi:hypothetical protein